MANCPVCKDELHKHTVICASCGLPHHAECWKEMDKCATFGCESHVQSDRLMPVDEFLSSQVTPVYDLLSRLLGGTPHGDTAAKYQTLYAASRQGILNPPVVLNQLNDALSLWKSYYQGRLEEMCSDYPMFEEMKSNPHQLRSYLKSFDWTDTNIAFIRNAVAALELDPELTKDMGSERHQARKRALDIGLAFGYMVVLPILPFTPSLPLVLMAYVGWGISIIEVAHSPNRDHSRLADYLTVKFSLLYTKAL